MEYCVVPQDVKTLINLTELMTIPTYFSDVSERDRR